MRSWITSVKIATMSWMTCCFKAVGSPAQTACAGCDMRSEPPEKGKEVREWLLPCILCADGGSGRERGWLLARECGAAECRDRQPGRSQAVRVVESWKGRGSDVRRAGGSDPLLRFPRAVRKSGSGKGH